MPSKHIFSDKQTQKLPKLRVIVQLLSHLCDSVEYFHDSAIVSDSDVYTMIFYCHESNYRERLS